MQKITLNKALKLKNKLSGEIRKIADRIRNNNSYKETNKPSYESTKLLEEYDLKVVELINLKTAINKGNINIFNIITELGEVKSKITILTGMSTQTGSHSTGYGGNQNEHIYVSLISEIQKNNMISELETKVEELQDKIDFYNINTVIEL